MWRHRVKSGARVSRGGCDVFLVAVGVTQEDAEEEFERLAAEMMEEKVMASVPVGPVSTGVAAPSALPAFPTAPVGAPVRSREEEELAALEASMA